MAFHIEMYKHLQNIYLSNILHPIGVSVCFVCVCVWGGGGGSFAEALKKAQTTMMIVSGLFSI